MTREIVSKNTNESGNKIVRLESESPYPGEVLLSVSVDGLRYQYLGVYLDDTLIGMVIETLQKYRGSRQPHNKQWNTIAEKGGYTDFRECVLDIIHQTKSNPGRAKKLSVLLKSVLDDDKLDSKLWTTLYCCLEESYAMGKRDGEQLKKVDGV